MPIGLNSLSNSVRKAIEKAAKDYSSLPLFDVEAKNISTFGDFSSNLPFALAKTEGKNPREIALELKENLESQSKGMFEKIEVAGGGFLNFFLKDKFVLENFKKQIGKKVKINSKKSKKVIVEFSSPNVAKPMHPGHLRNTILGNFISNLYGFLGYKVIKWNHLGDWGTQYGKLIRAYKMWGQKNKVEKNPIKELLDLYVRFNNEAKIDPKLEETAREEFKKLEEQDKENIKLLNWFLSESLKELNKIYKDLGISFNIIKGESFYIKDKKIFFKELEKKGFLKESQGALIFDLNTQDMPPILMEKSDGATLYHTRDLLSLKYRLEKFKPDEILYVVGNEQSLYLKQLFRAARMLNWDIPLRHISYGLILNKNGKKISTREGDNVFAQDLIENIKKSSLKAISQKRGEMSKKEMEKISREVGISALKYNFLKDYRESDIVFDPQKALSLQGNSGPYVQYAYARLSNILSKVKKTGKFDLSQNGGKEMEIIKKLLSFEDIILDCLRDSSSHHLTDYLFSLANLANNFYETTPILKDEDKKRKSSRLVLIREINKILEKGLSILGIRALNRI